MKKENPEPMKIEIEIGKNMSKVIIALIKSYNEEIGIGYTLQQAFGIDFTKIADSDLKEKIKKVAEES